MGTVEKLDGKKVENSVRNGGASVTIPSQNHELFYINVILKSGIFRFFEFSDYRKIRNWQRTAFHKI